MNPVAVVQDRLEARECRPVRSGGGLSARCPAHEDRRASLSVAEGEDGRALLTCHAGCAFPDIVAALGLEEKDCFPEKEKRSSTPGKTVATYPYVDEAGKLLYEVIRMEPKAFRQRRPNPSAKSGWEWSLNGTRRVLFQLPKVLAAIADGQTVCIAEGEKDVLALEALGLTATCNPGGADPGNGSKWKQEFADVLQGANVVIFADNDEAGRRHADFVARTLVGKASRIRLVELPDLPPKGDVSDWLAAGGTLEQLREIAKSTPDWIPRAVVSDEAEAHTAGGQSEATFEWIAPPAGRPRPKLPTAALHGLAGRFVRMVSPHTEGDPLAVLTGFLVRFGVAVGRSPHFRVGGDRHGANLFAGVVGPTSAGKKGTADGEARRVFRLASCAPPEASGLSSGEGLIAAIRDEVRVVRPVKERGRVVDHEEVVEDPGVSDKRLLVVESELGSVLRRMERDGNSLSPVMRQAWDSLTLKILTKKAITATDPHVGLVASITPSELEALLSEGEALNGWGNRILWVDVLRPHLLPHGGNLCDEDLLPLAQELREAVEFGTTVGEMARDSAASSAWERVYEPLTSDRPGLFGAMTARGAQHVLRLSVVYALLDRERLIRPVHLQAALAFWQAAEESARGLFGNKLGDRVAESLLEELRGAPDGLSRTDLIHALGRNVSSARIGQALGHLSQLGLARGRRETSDGRGRPTERWFLNRLTDELHEVDELNPGSPTLDPGISSSTSFHSSGSPAKKAGEAGR